MTLAADIKSLIIARLDTSSPQEILRIGGAIAANEQIEIAGTAAAFSRPAGAGIVSPRFINLGADGKPTSGEHVAVHDSRTGLTWSRGVLEGRRSWKESLDAAKACRLMGKEDWRAPTLEERLSINDYTKHSPALDTAHFAKESGWEWTSTPDAGSPSFYAWGVNLGSGSSDRNGQSDDYCVRAVRAGQQFALGI